MRTDARARRRRGGAALLAGVVLVLLAPGCASSRHYVRIAEGLSSPTISEGIRVAPRMFSGPQLVEACKYPVRVARLKVAPETLELTEGNLYVLSSLSVVAVNGADIAVPGVPIVLEAEDTNPPVLQLRSDDPDLDAGRLRVIGTGPVRMRVRTMCGLPHAEAIIEVRAGS